MSMRYAFRMFAIAWLVGVTAVQAQTLRDPTRPPGGGAGKSVSGGAVAQKEDLELQSILISPERRAAIISGRVVRLGESVQGYRVVAIGEGEAVLRMDGQSRTLRLFPAVDLQQPGVGVDSNPADGG